MSLKDKLLELLKSDIKSYNEDFERLQKLLKSGKKANVGEIREWKDGKYIKRVKGWDKVPDKKKNSGKKEASKEIDQKWKVLLAKFDVAAQKLGAKNYESLRASDRMTIRESFKNDYDELITLRNEEKEVTNNTDKEVNNKTNMLGGVDFSKLTPIQQKKFYRHLNEINIIIDSIGIKFKEPLYFKADKFSSKSKRVMARYMPKLRMIEIKDHKHSNLSLIHEIGHAIDHAMGDIKEVRSEEVKDLYDKKLQESYIKLSDLVKNSPYYKEVEVGSLKKYLNKPTEIFARAFEVYALTKAEHEISVGNIQEDFIETFTPAIFRRRYIPEDSNIKQEIKDLGKVIDTYYSDSKKVSLKQMLEAKSKMDELLKEAKEMPIDEQNDIKSQIVEIMDSIFSVEEIRKSFLV